MATQIQIAWLLQAAQDAVRAKHIWPAMAACEAAVESSWGTSKLAVEAHNIFGCKQHAHPIYGTVNMPTREYLHGQWTTETAAWVNYPSDQAAFEDRMNTLRTLASAYPHYADALAATTAEEYVTQVSASWSTDPNRAATCIAIFHAHQQKLMEAISDGPSTD